MHRYITRMCAVMAVGLLLSAVGVTSAGASGPAFGAGRLSSPGVPQARAARSGARLWVKHYKHAFTGGQAVVVSPNGKRVFVTGSASSDYGTVAYKAATGAQLWARRYKRGRGQAIAVSPNGKRVFVTGWTYGTEDYATVAYNAATGHRLWAKRYAVASGSANFAESVAVSHTGRVVVVTGWDQGTAGIGYLTVAYNAATGHRLWVKRYAPAGNIGSEAWSVAASPKGKAVFVTGQSDIAGQGSYATIAYNATTGARLWVKRYGSLGAGASSVAVSPTGATVYITGTSGAGIDVTVAYRAATGARLWAKSYKTGHVARAVVTASPNGKAVFVTVPSIGPNRYTDYATIAYKAATGHRLWAKRYAGTGEGGDSYAIAVNHTGTKVYVTGASPAKSTGYTDYATVAYKAATGARLWVRRYAGPSRTNSVAYAVAVSPTRGTVFVTGISGVDYVTIAYAG